MQTILILILFLRTAIGAGTNAPFGDVGHATMGDVFVTADDEFHKPAKKAALLTLGAGHIERPAEAVAAI